MNRHENSWCYSITYTQILLQHKEKKHIMAYKIVYFEILTQSIIYLDDNSI